MRAPRVHKSSVILGLLALGMMTLIIVPGEIISPLGGNFGGGYVAKYAHGWPLTFVTRSYFYDFATSEKTFPDIPKWYVPWIAWDSWQLWESSEEFADQGSNQIRVAALLLDLLAWLAIPAAFAAAWEWRRRRQLRWRRFRLVDLFLLTTLACMLGGWWTHASRVRRLEIEASEAIWDDGHIVHEKCRSPEWLAGEANLPAFFLRTHEVVLMDANDQQLETFIKAARHFPKLRTLEVYAQQKPAPLRFSRLSAVCQLKILSLGSSGYIADERAAEELGALNQIRFLYVPEKARVPAAVLQELERALPRCQILDERPVEAL
jgi:hypothetical protein